MVAMHLTCKEKGRVFLGGPIQFALRGSCGFDPHLKKAIEVIGHAVEGAGYELFSAHFAERFAQLDATTASPESITLRDFRWMLQCDLYLALLPLNRRRIPYRSDGTCIELGWASALSKPIVCLLGNAFKYSHLIRGLSGITNYSILDFDLIFSSPNSIVSVIRSLLSSRTSLVPSAEGDSLGVMSS